MKIVFGDPDKKVVHLAANDGGFQTSSHEASVRYTFCYSDHTINLGVYEQWFDEDDIDDFIDFLKAVKEQLK